ncbi:MAG TPA: alpha/beta hydrolase [Anaeromyxobacteraceae bacterium]|nr:alpha/beta hydrolase [Anaeromyxobacteraceae bacterium]
MEEMRLRANGLEFFALADGPEAGPLVLLLHGFPELSRSWRRQVRALSRAGYRAVAPDLRGYGETEKRGPYDLETLARDVREIVRSLGRERAVVVGHDWGGAVAWAVSSYHPEAVERLVAMSCPPPGALAEELARNPRQLLRSWYMFLFQLPLLPEWILTRRGAAAVGRALRGGSHVREAWPREETAPYRAAMLRPGAARGALGYYRAAFRRPWQARTDGRRRPVVAPVLVLFGTHDRFLGRELFSAERLAPYLAPGNRPKIVFLESAGHFVQNEDPQRVDAELLGWLGRPAGARPPP